jgi:hypothetical protein
VARALDSGELTATTLMRFARAASAAATAGERARAEVGWLVGWLGVWLTDSLMTVVSLLGKWCEHGPDQQKKRGGTLFIPVGLSRMNIRWCKKGKGGQIHETTKW